MLPSLSRRTFLSSTLVAGGALMGGAWWRQQQERTLHTINRSAAALGTKVHISVLHHDEAAAHGAIDAAIKALDELEDVLSIYRPHSQVSQLNRDGALDHPHEDLQTVLRAALQMSQRTGGAFDCTIEPLWALHARAYRAGRTPEPAEIIEAQRLVGWARIHTSPSRIAFERPGMALTFNGIAQGFATDRVREVLAAHGITHAMIDVGELTGLGDKAGQPWRIGIQHPRDPQGYAALAHLDGRSLATSGDYASSFSADFSSHHILDPATGLSPQQFASVSIAAPTAMLADALSTAMFVLDADKGVRLVRAMQGVDALFVFKDGRTMTTPGFPRVS